MRFQEEGSYSPPSSADSEELRATRPNRWTGAPSTWRGLTEGDRAVWKAMEGGRKKELGVHLVGAWGVRRGRRRGRAAPEDGDGEGSDHDSRASTPRKRKKRAWSPGKMWTAWPMRFHQVPHDDIMSDLSGDDEPRKYKVPRTTKMSDLTRPNTNLEEAISATVLRIAKDKFLARGLTTEAVVDSVEAGGSDYASEGDGTGLAAGVTDGEYETGGNGEETDRGQPQKQRRARSPLPLKPVPTADDEFSYALLKPVSRKIIGQLDETLFFLHHAREAGLGLKNRDVGSEMETGPKNEKRKGTSSKKERATKSPGVTDGEQMEIDPPAEESNPQGRPGKGKQRKERRRSRTSQPRSTRSRSRSQAPSLPKRIRKWATRDWRDIIGVAAMAGFPPKVIARATQRCSTLFQQPMLLHRMPDGPAPVETTTYVPGAPLPPSDDDNEAEIKVQQIRAVSRNSSRRTSISLDTDATTATPAKSRKSTPGGPGKEFPCPHFTCPRAVEPFNRRANLMRHLKVMHAGIEAAAQMAEQKSGDEMDGAVHVDGFLKPVRARRGWRGEDTKARTRQKGLKYKTADPGPSKRRARKKSTFDSD
ncbi:hypothetical protein B0T18DRAFT_326037 [Schizothecium vesticola]|uniref:C2H2-type domain-containing protein n=1 Tax=Schizothecium vesticola TaxID=314040 RepID=A0AA40EUT6_9PEZI|nr:hypothetical protein B0T18DRAFT_326037 [Schizothecium vesticola]